MLTTNQNYYRSQPINYKTANVNNSGISELQRNSSFSLPGFKSPSHIVPAEGGLSYETSSVSLQDTEPMSNLNANKFKEPGATNYGRSYNNPNIYSNYGYGTSGYLGYSGQVGGIYDTHSLSPVSSTPLSRKTNTYQSHFDYKMYPAQSSYLGASGAPNSTAPAPAPLNNYTSTYGSEAYNPNSGQEGNNFKRKKTNTGYDYSNIKSNFVGPGYVGPPQKFYKGQKKRNSQAKAAAAANGATPNSYYGRDSSYPEDLNKMLTPAHCDLCGVEHNSVASAKIHYDSKAHDRNLTNWFYLNYVSKGMELPAFKRFYQGKEITVEDLYCKICDLRFTSPIISKQHYEGRKHRFAVEKNKEKEGQAPEYAEGGNENACASTAAPEAKKPTNAKQGMDNNLRCELCSVDTTSLTQMANHLQGANHKRKLKLASVVGDVDFAANENSSILALAVQDQFKSEVDITPYRRGDGEFYCDICQVRINHETILRLHLFGKKHLKKESEQKAMQE